MIAALLLFNAALGFLQEGRAGAALAALKKRLAPTALVRRDGEWVRLPASELVSGDAIGCRSARWFRRRGHRFGIAAGRPVDAHRRIRPGRGPDRPSNAPIKTEP